MKKLTIINKKRPEHMEIPKDIWDQFEEDAMPGKCLGLLRVYREEIENTGKFKNPGYKFDSNDQINVLYEALVCTRYIYHDVNSMKEEEVSQYTKTIAALFANMYYMLAKELNCDNVIIDLDQNTVCSEELYKIV